MAVGLFGGTFDPVHMGHLRVAEEVRERFSLQKIYFVPTWIQPLKQQVQATKAEDRLKMIEMAVRNNPFFRVSAVEIRRGGVSYSIDTIKLFSRRFSDVYFLVGMDAFSDIALWKEWDRLFYYAHFIVMVRPGRKVEGPPADLKGQVFSIGESTWEHSSGKRIYFHDITQLDISSTKIRELSKNGNSIKYLVPTNVERFITQKGLYVE